MLWRGILEEPNVANHPEDTEQSKRMLPICSHVLNSYEYFFGRDFPVA